MVGWAVLGFFLLIALLLGGRALLNADPKTLVKVVRYGGAVVLGLIAAFFLFAGRIALAWPIGLCALAVLGAGGRSPFPRFGFPGAGRRQPSGGQRSEIATPGLRMILDHDTGEMTGTVLSGPLRGHDLAGLSFPQLVELYRHFEANDAEGATLLATYLERAQGDDWRAWRDQNERAGGPSSSSEGTMTIREALNILGLKSGASVADIKAAHKKLMKKMHPDQGGSTYLASKINRAKEILLESNGRGTSG